jgi:hypothetical protein
LYPLPSVFQLIIETDSLTVSFHVYIRSVKPGVSQRKWTCSDQRPVWCIIGLKLVCKGGFAVNDFPNLSPQDLTFDPLLDAGFDGSEVLQTSCAARNIRATAVRQAGVRVTVPGDASRLAGALGAEFLPDQSGQLLIMALASDLRGGGDAPLSGMPPNYARDVLGAARATDELAALGAGVLRFDRALYSPEDSSPELFEWMASAVVRLLVPELRELPEDEFFALLGVGQLAHEAAEMAADEAYTGTPDVIWLDDVPMLPLAETFADVPPAEEPLPTMREDEVAGEAAFVFDDILGTPADQAINIELPPEDALALGRVKDRSGENGDEAEVDAEVDSVLAALLQAFYEERRGEPREPISLDFVLPAEEPTGEQESAEATLSDLLTSLYAEAPEQAAEEPPADEAEWWIDPDAEPAMSEMSGGGEDSATPAGFSPIFDDEM